MLANLIFLVPVRLYAGAVGKLEQVVPGVIPDPLCVPLLKPEMGLGESEGRLDELAMPRRTFMREINFLRWSTSTGTGLDALGARSKNSFVLSLRLVFVLLLFIIIIKNVITNLLLCCCLHIIVRVVLPLTLLASRLL